MTPPRLETISARQLAGMRSAMSFAADETAALWRRFMPLLKSIPGRQGTDLYSLEIYPADFFALFDPIAVFEKWAAVEVEDQGGIPEGLTPFSLPGGLYAVFIHRGPASEGPRTYHYIFETWMPGSGYTVDDRPHFALMGEKYKNNSPESEEEIWIPIRPRA